MYDWYAIRAGIAGIVGGSVDGAVWCVVAIVRCDHIHVAGAENRLDCRVGTHEIR